MARVGPFRSPAIADEEAARRVRRTDSDGHYRMKSANRTGWGHDPRRCGRIKGIRRGDSQNGSVAGVQQRFDHIWTLLLRGALSSIQCQVRGRCPCQRWFFHVIRAIRLGRLPGIEKCTGHGREVDTRVGTVVSRGEIVKVLGRQSRRRSAGMLVRCGGRMCEAGRTETLIANRAEPGAIVETDGDVHATCSRTSHLVRRAQPSRSFPCPSMLISMRARTARLHGRMCSKTS